MSAFVLPSDGERQVNFGLAGSDVSYLQCCVHYFASDLLSWRARERLSAALGRW